VVLGKGVELQWKMQAGSPFGWWYGVLESLRIHGDGLTATAKLTFRHFPLGSRWYELDVVFGDNKIRPGAIGGYTGGIRGVTDEENLRWMVFFRNAPGSL